MDEENVDTTETGETGGGGWTYDPSKDPTYDESLIDECKHHHDLALNPIRPPYIPWYQYQEE